METIKPRKFPVSLIILAAAAALFLFFYFPSFSNYRNLAAEALSFPYSIDYGEGPLLDQVLRLASGEGIYDSDFAAPPYTISNYPPVFLLAQVPFAWVFGPALWYGRAISLVSALLAALFLGLTLHTLTRDWLAALVGGLLLLAYPYVQFWSLLNRIDLLALAFSWAGIFAAVRWSDRRWGLPLAAGLLVASIYTRQSYALAAPLGVLVWMLLTRQVGRAIRLGVMVGGASLALFLLLNLLSGGGFYRNIVLANVNPFYWQTVSNNARDFASHSVLLLLMAGVFLLLERGFPHTRSWPLVLAYSVGAAASAVTIGKDGSNVNYLLELTAAIAFASGASFAWLGRALWARLALLLVLVLQLGILQEWTQNDYNSRITGKTIQEMNMFRLANVVSEANGIILTDEEMGLIPLAGKRLYFQPFEYKMLADAGMWDETALLQSIQDHDFALIILHDSPYWDSLEGRWTPAALSAIRKYYRLEKTISHNRIYRPKE